MGNSRQSGIRVGRLLPALLVAALVVDLGSRFVRIDRFTFRAWEALVRYSLPGAQFEGNRVYVNEESYGDLAAMGNLPRLRQYHRERFTTDNYGFRNGKYIEGRPIGVILVGDSFSSGSGIDEDQTLSSQLAPLIGTGVYNAAGIEPAPEPLIALADRLHMRRGTVIYQYLERDNTPTIPAQRAALAKRLWRSAPRSLLEVDRALSGYCSISPVQILAGRILKRLEDDVILPNRYKANVVVRALSNGDEMLFLPKDVAVAEKQRPASGAYWSWLRDKLAARQLDLLVVLVPTKYTVYGAPKEAGAYLARLEEDLALRGVKAVNVAPAFIKDARSRLPRRDYLYWRDDTHWNPQGIALAATLIQARMQSSKNPDL